MFSVFVRRYGEGAIFLTTIRTVEDCGKVLGDTATTGPVPDRFLHHDVVVRP